MKLGLVNRYFDINTIFFNINYMFLIHETRTRYSEDHAQVHLQIMKFKNSANKKVVIFKMKCHENGNIFINLITLYDYTKWRRFHKLFCAQFLFQLCFV